MGDITNKLDKITTLGDDWNSSLQGTLKRGRDLQESLSGLKESEAEQTTKLVELEEQKNAALAKGLALEEDFVKMIEEEKRALRGTQGELGNINRQLAKQEKSWKTISKLIGVNLLQSIDKFGKSLITFGFAVFEKGIQALQDGIYKVYELQERWTKAMGEFKLAIGPTSSNLKGLTREATKAEGVFRGLTDQFGLGIQELGAVTKSFGFTGKEFEKFRMTSVMAGRAFGFGSDATGKLSRSIKLMGGEGADASDTLVQIAKDANAAGVDAAEYGKEIAGATEFMAGFGKKSKDVFLGAAMYAKKMGVALKSLEAFTRMTDTFDNAATSMATLNTVFGTTINSLDLMLEEDPSKRFEMVRAQLKSVGRDVDNMSRHEKQLLADTMKISVEEVNAMLSSGETLEEIQAKRDKAARTEKQNQAFIQKALKQTATTMFAFGAAWDRITKAIAKLIKPFTDLLGLTKSGEKGAKSFGETMGAAFDRLEKFIEEIAANPEWQNFMKRLAGDAKNLAKWLSESLTGPKLGEWIHAATKFGHDFYDMMKTVFTFIVEHSDKFLNTMKWVLEHSKSILAVWAGAKGISGLMSAAKFAKGSGVLGTAKNAAGFARGAASMSSVGATAGMGVAGIATIAAGVIGSAAVGYAVGSFLDDKLGLSDSLSGTSAYKYTETPEAKKAKSETIKAELELAKAIGKRIEQEEANQKQMLIFSAENQKRHLKESASKEIISNLEKTLSAGKQKSIQIESGERTELISYIQDLQRLGVNSKDLSGTLGVLMDGGNVSAKMLKALERSSNEYEKTVAKLNAQSDMRLKRDSNQLELDRARQKVKSDEALAQFDPKIAAKQAAVDRAKKFKLDFASQKEADDALGAAAASGSITEDEKTELLKLTRESFDTIAGDSTGKANREKLAKILNDKKIGLMERDLEEEKRKKIDFQKKMEADEMNHGKKLHAIQVRNMIQMSSGFQEFRTKNKEGTLEEAFNKYITQKDASGGNMFSDEERASLSYNLHSGNSASGGIFTRPQTRLIGEAGPEAIIPLKAMARGAGPQPSKFGGEAARKLVNFAAGGAASSGQQQVVVVAGDVHLDGQKVGRHLVRQLMEQD